MINSSSLAVAQYIEQTSLICFKVFKTLIGYPCLITIINVCPAAMFWAFLIAKAFSWASLPSARIKHFPEDSQKAMPNFIPGTEAVNVSYTSSTVLMKWACPIMIFASSGLAIFTLSNLTSLIPFHPVSKADYSKKTHNWQQVL